MCVSELSVIIDDTVVAVRKWKVSSDWWASLSKNSFYCNQLILINVLESDGYIISKYTFYESFANIGYRMLKLNAL